MKSSYYCVFNKDSLLLKVVDEDRYALPYSEDVFIGIKADTFVHNIDYGNGIKVKAFGVYGDVKIKEGYVFCNLRESYYKISREEYLIAGKCSEIVYWDRMSKFCGFCGGEMEKSTDISKKCKKCGKEIWPELATAVIVLISKGDEILLVRALNFRSSFFGLVAGFVETGESLEEAVEREVMEETGLKIKNISYYKSQSWPYPCGLMVGFYAEWESGDIRIQKSELIEGGWYKKDSLPEIPSKLSIARMLIDNWIKK